MKLASFAGGAVLVTAIFAAVALTQRADDARTHRETESLRAARALAWVYGEDAEAAQALVNALPKEVLKGAVVLKGTKFVVHSDPEKAGKSLSQESLTDKALYDTAQLIKANSKKNLEEHEKDSSLTRDPFPEVELRARTAAAPAKSEGRYVALAQVELETPPVHAAFPWMIWVFALTACGLFLPLASHAGKAAIPIGLALLAIVAALDVRELSAWRGGTRRAQAAASAQTIGAFARAGMLAATPPDHRPELVSALSRDHDGALREDLLEVRSSTIALAPPRDGVRFESAPYEVWFREASFARAQEIDTHDLSRFGAFAFVIAALLFVLGSLGRLRDAYRALVVNRTAYGYLSPAMLGMGVLVFIPVVYGIVLGFTSASSRDAPLAFNGLTNYLAILSDFDFSSTKNFYFKLGVTLMWTSANVVLHVGIGLFIALLLNDELLKAKGIYRVLLVVPWAIPNYITALIWKGMFHKQFGAVNFALEGLGLEPVAWFQSFVPAFLANVSTNTWLGFPFMMVVSLGALQSIPTDLYEAAYVDGASRWQRFKDITFPLLMPALVPAVIMGTVWTFNMFNIIYLVSGGAPDGATDILITDAFRWAFERDKYGYAAAYSTIIFLILLFFTLVTNKVTGATKGAFE